MARKIAPESPAPASVPVKGWEVFFKVYPNPDLGQYGNMGLPETWRAVDSPEQASRVVRSFLDIHGLGSGNWGPESRRRRRDGVIVGKVSYNGRLWGTDGKTLAV
jgi:hypothetical protein